MPSLSGPDRSKDTPAKPNSAPKGLDESLENAPVARRELTTVLPPPAPTVTLDNVFEFRIMDGNDDLWGSVRIEASNEGAARVDLDDFLQKEVEEGGDIDLATVKVTLVSPPNQERPRWIDKANGIISELCQESYAKANIYPDGTKRKRHVPYSVPPLAQALVECLGTNDEERAKALFQTLHDLPELSRGN